MRVLFVNHTGLVSGAEHSLLTLIDGLPRENVAGLACPHGPLAEKARAQGVEVANVRGTTGSLRPHPRHTPLAGAELALSAVQVARAARRLGASVIHCNSIRAGLMGLGGGLDDRGLVVHLRDCLPDSASTRLLRRLLAREADELIAISNHVAESFRRGLPALRAPLRVIDNPVDLNRFRTDAARADELGTQGPLLAVVGQISPWKGQDTAIRALHRLRKAHPQTRLLIVGEVKFSAAGTRFDNRGYLASLHELVGQLGIEDAVEFLGERDDIPRIIGRVNAVLVPSTEEPFGRTVAEAMAMGRPVVATSVGGPAELIEDGVTGLLAPPEEPAGWSGAISRILDDPEWAAELGRRATEVARERFAVGRHVSAMRDLYESAESATR